MIFFSKTKSFIKEKPFLTGGFFLIILVFTVYAGAFYNGFVYDDHFQITDNPWLREVRFLSTIITSGVWEFDDFHDQVGYFSYYRPIMHLTFFIEFNIFGLNPMPYHTVNLFLHAVNSILVFYFIYLLLSKIKNSTLKEKEKKWTAFFTSLLFAVHPINSEVVNWIGATPELIMLLLLMVSSIFYLKERILLAAFFYFFSLFSKETAIFLPVLFVSIELALGGLKKISLRNTPYYLKKYYLFILAFAVYFGIRSYVLIGGVEVGNNYASRVEQVLSWFVVIIFNLFSSVIVVAKNIWLIIFPTRLSILKEESISTYDGYLVVIVIALVCLLFFLRKVNIFPRIKFSTEFLLGSSIFIIFLIPSLNLYFIGKNIFSERYLYFPSVGLFLIISFWGIKVFKFLKKKDRLFFVGLILLVSMFYVWTTISRTADWLNEEVLFSSVVEKKYDSFTAYGNLAWLYCDRGEEKKCEHYLSEAYRASKKCISGAKNCKERYSELYYLNSANNSSAQKKHEEAVDWLMRLDPEKASKSQGSEVYFKISNIYFDQNEFDKSKKMMNKALKLYPESGEINLKMGTLYCTAGELKISEDYYSRSYRYGQPIENIVEEKIICLSKIQK